MVWPRMNASWPRLQSNRIARKLHPRRHKRHNRGSSEHLALSRPTTAQMPDRTTEQQTQSKCVHNSAPASPPPGSQTVWGHGQILYSYQQTSAWPAQQHPSGSQLASTTVTTASYIWVCQSLLGSTNISPSNSSVLGPTLTIHEQTITGALLQPEQNPAAHCWLCWLPWWPACSSSSLCAAAIVFALGTAPYQKPPAGC
jgi:hypothetical protein